MVVVAGCLVVAAAILMRSGAVRAQLAGSFLVVLDAQPGAHEEHAKMASGQTGVLRGFCEVVAEAAHQRRQVGSVEALQQLFLRLFVGQRYIHADGGS